MAEEGLPPKEATRKSMGQIQGALVGIAMVLSAVFGLIPLLFLLPRWTTILWPTVLCAAVSVIYLAGLGLFVGRDTWQELHKRLHM